jgi:hypothetical protein
MSDELNQSSDSDVGCTSAHQISSAPVPKDGVLKHTLRRRIVLIAIEILLVIVIVGLLVATWLPAIIGANPDASHGGPFP